MAPGRYFSWSCSSVCYLFLLSALELILLVFLFDITAAYMPR